MNTNTAEDFRKYLESKNFTRKGTSSFKWNYEIELKKKSENITYNQKHVWLNPVGNFMREQARNKYGNLNQYTFEERKKFYFKILGKLPKFKNIQHSVTIKEKPKASDRIGVSTMINSKVLIEFFEDFRANYLGQ